MTEPVAAEVGLRLAAALDGARVPYALGGALAYGIWAPPRGTMDVDINLFVTPEALPVALDVLAAEGMSFEREDAMHGALNGGQFIVRAGPMRVDVFTPSIDFSWEALRTRVRATAAGQEAWFLAAEALCIFKLLYFRTKDIADMERMVAAQGKRLDASYVHRWIADMMGDDDPRVLKWDELVTSFWR